MGQYLSQESLNQIVLVPKKMRVQSPEVRIQSTLDDHPDMEIYNRFEAGFLANTLGYKQTELRLNYVKQFSVYNTYFFLLIY